MVEAVARASSKIVSGLPEKGASFALDLEVKARVGLAEEKGAISGDVEPELKELAGKVLEFYGCDNGLKIEVETGARPDSGLGVSEASAIATALGVAGALAREHGSIDELKIDKYLKEQYMVISEKLVDKNKLLELCAEMGEYDRLCASLYGGFIVSDNRKRAIALRGEMETMDVVLAFPHKPAPIDSALLRLYKNELELIWDEAVKGNLYTAMKLNTLLYETELPKKMLEAGAIASTVSFPSVIGLARDEGKLKEIEDAVKEQAATQVVKISNEPAKVLVKPRRIVKTKEFLEIKGAQEYHFL